jgi:hypothetical protein
VIFSFCVFLVKTPFFCLFAKILIFIFSFDETFNFYVKTQ